ncbi:hypothetical protein Bhyg_07020 [Pseudolycoriella hygida]|uniref:CUB domain-containing protein n=1 Tax=Pseudolycoriella hygida TaxID=35572 RepID=A0A9Q0S2F7_9DIPT|nr:hypothetical protein Bhyg_07020 [Pseudolycoriella hygida]
MVDFFPFYTIGRFPNTACTGINDLTGTCVLAGECKDAGGIATGTCTTLTVQAVCCVYQATCGDTASYNNTYFVNPGYPGSWSGGSSCSLTISPASSDICQVRLDFLDLTLASPSGDGVCNRDAMTISGGSSSVPALCGTNGGQHVYVNFDGSQSISINIAASSSFTLGRKWHIKVTQIDCNSALIAPSGCLQYYWGSSGVIRSFNYGSAANSALNTVGVDGTRQIANLNYGICIAAAADQCSITYSTLSSDSYSFTVTGDVGAVDPSLLGTSALQDQACTTDYVVIPSPTQNNAPLMSDRFCGLGLAATTITDGNEQMDIGNRGFSLSYSQNECPVII